MCVCVCVCVWLVFRKRFSRLQQTTVQRPANSFPVDGWVYSTPERPERCGGVGFLYARQYADHPRTGSHGSRGVRHRRHELPALVPQRAGQRRWQRELRRHESAGRLPVERREMRPTVLLRVRRSQRYILEFDPRRLYILCWSELSRRRLLPTVSPAAGHLTTPTVSGLPGLCETFRPTTSKSSPILRLQSSHWATSVVRTRVVGVANVGDSLRRLSSLRHRIYNLLGSIALREKIATYGRHLSLKTTTWRCRCDLDLQLSGDVW